MLDNDTKRRIDTARDILVGKVPDPKSQVEQITIALIYKFMDDMDAESVGFGGKPVFFTGAFEQYRWVKLIDTRLGGLERLNRYGEALTRMTQNPGLPQLFRDIFKNAFLPYRDPETLSLFLKTIDEFKYDHSERLGDAFEYLLSVLGSQGGAGQFRTPRHIIDFMVQVVDPKKHETVLDPACGTAGFLISSYKHILAQNTRPDGRPGDLLSPAERTRLMENFQGYDISPDMVRLSLVNMYLHQFPVPRIVEYDTLTSEDRWNDYFDVVLANPPFMSPKGGIKPHKRFSIQSNRSEVLFVDYIAEHLLPGGRAAIIVPEGIIFQSGRAYKDLRKMLVDNYLWAVVSLPAGVFNPYSGVKTSILLLDKQLARRADHILFAKINAEGFGLGAQRRPAEANDLPAALAALLDYKKAMTPDLRRDDWQAPDERFLLVEKEKIRGDGEWGLSGERYANSFSAENSDFEFVPLGEVVDFFRGITFGKNDQLEFENENSIRVATTKAAQEWGLDESSLYFVPKSFVKNEKLLLRENDILISVANSLNLVGRTTLVPKLNYPASFGAFMGLIRAKNEKIHPLFLFHLLRTNSAKTYFLSVAKTTTNISNLNFSDLADLLIPLPPLAVQREIVAEIEGYERIVAGARQVVEAYRPRIEIDPAWEVVELGEVCEIEYGFTETAKEDGGARFLRITDIGSDGQLKSDNAKFVEITEDSKRYFVKKDDLLVARTGGTYGKTMIFEETYPAIFASFLIRINPNKSKLLPKFYWCFAQSENYWSQAETLVTGGGQPQFNGGALKKIQIPLPPLPTQQHIVAQIERERRLVAANRELTGIFEQKIKERIARVWGEGAH